MLPEWEITWNSLVDVNTFVTASKERRLSDGLRNVNIFNIVEFFSDEIQIEDFKDFGELKEITVMNLKENESEGSWRPTPYSLETKYNVVICSNSCFRQQNG